MRLSELVAKVGDDNIAVQSVAHSFLGGTDGKNGARMTLAVDKDKLQSLMRETALGAPPQWVALVLWIPADKMPELTDPKEPA